MNSIQQETIKEIEEKRGTVTVVEDLPDSDHVLVETESRVISIEVRGGRHSRSKYQFTVERLIAALAGYPSQALVTLEGCDCENELRGMSFSMNDFGPALLLGINDPE